MPPPRSAGSAVVRIRRSTRCDIGRASGCMPPFSFAAACQVRARSVNVASSLSSTQSIRSVATLTMMVSPSSTRCDWSSEKCLRRDVAHDDADGAAGESSVGHETDRDASLTTERGDLRSGFEHFGHSGRAARSFVSNHDHVAVLEFSRPLIKGIRQGSLAVKHPSPTGEDPIGDATLHASKFQDRSAVRREVSTQVVGVHPSP